jgi:antitoxin HicB
MYAYQYPAEFTPATEGGFVVTFPDLPEAITQGETVQGCIHEATDALDEAIMGRINRGQEIPKASTAKAGQYLISVPMQTALKSALHEEIIQQGATKVDFAERMGMDEKEIRRLLDPRHPSKLPRLVNLLHRAGKRATVVIESESDILVHG